MGQRHQAFIIARLVPLGSTDKKAYYRCIGGWHHQWCYGKLPLRSADRFITLVKNPVNAALVREEIKTVQGKLPRYNPYGSMSEQSDSPCPYTFFLLASAFSIDFDRQYVYSAPLDTSSLPADMSCWGGDNNDGITILDVTDPLNPRYAFALERGTVYTAQYYLSGYGSEDPDLVDRFKNVPLLTPAMLVEAWPRDWAPSKTRNTHFPDILRHNPGIEGVPISNSVPSLVDLVVEPAVAHSLELGNTAQVELLVPAKFAQIKAVLRRRDPFPEAGLPLLMSVLQEELKQNANDTMDLAGFSLSSDQLASIVAKIESTQNVVLSDSPHVLDAHVRALLTTKPEIGRLEISNTGVTDAVLTSLLNEHPELFKRVSDVIHHLFISAELPLTKVGAFHTFVNEEPSSGYRRSKLDGSSMCIWSPAKVIQNSLKWLLALADSLDNKYEASARFRSFMFQAAMSTGFEILDGQTCDSISWKDRMVTALGRNMKVQGGDWMFLFEQPAPEVSKETEDLDETEELDETEDLDGTEDSDETEDLDGSEISQIPTVFRYTFGKVLPDKSGVQTYDLGGFLEETSKGGRGPLPSATVIKEWNDLMVTSEIAQSRLQGRDALYRQALTDSGRKVTRSNLSDLSSGYMELSPEVDKWLKERYMPTIPVSLFDDSAAFSLIQTNLS